MNQTKWAEDMLEFMTSTFEATMSTLTTLQDQGEKVLSALMDQGVVAQQEGRKVLNEWATMARRGREDYKRVMTENLIRVSEFFKSNGTAAKNK